MANPGLEDVDKHSQEVADRENGNVSKKPASGKSGKRVTYNSVNDTYKDAVANLKSSKSADFARSRKDYEKRTDLSEDEKDKRAYADLVALGLHKPVVKVAPKGKARIEKAKTQKKSVPTFTGGTTKDSFKPSFTFKPGADSTEDQSTSNFIYKRKDS